MKRFSEQLQTKAKSVKLKASERKELRERVCSYMEYHPLPASMQEQVAKTPAAAAFTEPYRNVIFNWVQLVKYGAITASLVLIIVPMLAERTIPGDTLYSVKVRFNEEVRSTLTWDPYQKVEWETTRLNRRLAEARLLAEEGKLTTEAEADVVAAVKEHSDNAKHEIAEIGESDAETAAIASIALDSTLSVHANALKKQSATGTVAIAAALTDASQPFAFSSSTIPAYSKLMARVEQQTTRVYELFEQLKAVADDSKQTELADVTRRLEDIERAVSEAIALREEDELAARTILVDVLQRTGKLTVFMTDITVRQSVSVEEVVPVVFTKEEQVTQLNELGNELDAALALVEAALEEIDDESVSEKLARALTDVRALQTSASSLDFKQNFTQLRAALEIALDAAAIAKQYVQEAEAVPEEAAASSTEPVASSTEAVVLETEEPVASTSTAETIDPLDSSTVSEVAATTTELTDVVTEVAATATIDAQE